MTQLNKIREIYIWIILVSMSTAFSFAIGARDMNLLLVGVMAIISVFLFLQFPYLKKSEVWMYLLFLTILICGIRHFETFRITTVLYSLMFMLTFLYYFRLIYNGVLQANTYLKIIKTLIVAYFITLFIQQISILAGFSYVFNQIHTWDSDLKLNALSPEPSQTSRILLLLMYSYLSIKELRLNRNYNLAKDARHDRLIWFLFLYVMLTMGSGTAFLFLPILLYRYIKLRQIVFFLPIVVIIVLILISLDLTVVNRVVAFSKAVVTLDATEILRADHSASFRIVPTILYLQMFDITSMNTWFGHGIDYDVFLFPTIIPGLPEGQGTGGIFPTFLMNYGLISGVVLFFMINKFCFKKIWSFDTFFWLFMIGPEPFNTQLFGLSILLWGTNKYFLNRSLEVENPENKFVLN